MFKNFEHNYNNQFVERLLTILNVYRNTYYSYLKISRLRKILLIPKQK